MTKEELREHILELSAKIQKEDSKSAISEMDKECENLLDELEGILFEELNSLKVIIRTEVIVDRYDVDMDLIVSDYIETGNLEDTFKVISGECDCGWKTKIKKEILK